MRVAFCASSTNAHRIVRSLDAEDALVVAATWEHFAKLLRTSRSGIVLIERLQGTKESRDLQRVRQGTVGKPIVLITRRMADNAAGIRDIGPDEVVWVEEIEDRLAGAVQRAEGQRMLAEVTAAILTTRDLHPKLRQALSWAVESPHAFTEVDDLAASVSRDRRSLYYHWGKRMPGSFTLKTYLDWVLLVRARLLKSSRRTWQATADQLEIERSHLSRVSRRLTGMRLGELGLLSSRHLVTRFIEELKKAGIDTVTEA